MKKLKICKNHYDMAKKIIEEENCTRNQVLAFSNCFNIDYDKSYAIIKAVKYDYKYLEVEE